MNEWTISVNDIVQLDAYKTIQLHIITTAPLILTAQSTYSIALVKAPQSLGTGFHAYLRKEVNFHYIIIPVFQKGGTLFLRL